MNRLHIYTTTIRITLTTTLICFLSDVQVHDMFLEVSVMVETQGEAVGRIEDAIGQAAHNVEQGRQQLEEAEKKKKSARKLKFILAGIGAGVALVVLLLLLFTI